MVNTYSKSLLFSRLKQWCEDLGYQVATHPEPVAQWEGKFWIDFPGNGHCALIRYVGTGGGERTVYHAASRSELLAWFNGATQALLRKAKPENWKSS